MTIPPGPPPYGPPGPLPPYGYGYPPPPPPPKPGVIPLAPLTFSTILTGAFATFGRYWKQLLGVTATVYGVAMLAVGAAVGIAYAAVGDLFPAVFDLPPGQEPQWDDVRPLLVAFACVWIAGMVTALCANAVIAAACPAVIQEAVLGRPATFGAVWRRSWARMPAVLGTVILTSLPMVLLVVVYVGTLVALLLSLDGGSPVTLVITVFGGATLAALPVVPLVLWLWVKFSLAPAAAVMENQGTVASMRRSSALVRGSWWRVFGCLLAAGVMAAVVGGLIQQAFSLLVSVPLATTDFSGDDPAAVIASLVGVFAFLAVGQLISQVVVSGFPPLITGLVYVDQRIRKENLAPDLARAAGLA
ncbi:oxidoreductase [Streptomyces sp. NBC_00233]|uniref:oxidoreductase n=1 Tax=Streptomyces sp. NBC_00233 TaxID=2975686 RepID=UPI002254DAC3|nr:oxidoreductase [Streptomyces sp. NBC_00233]MCX5225474.1 oxidoreductase [Streptomyces sp. NBC_00233]